MEYIEQKFSDKEGNHLLVALYFCDDDYKRNTLYFPEEYSNIDIIDISITKAYIDKPIHYSVFFRMTSWLYQEFTKNENAIFTFICSTDELTTNHPYILPQEFRWNLFDKLYQRQKQKVKINIQDFIIGPKEYQSFARAFYFDKHTPLVKIIFSYLKEKQQLYC